MRRPRLVGDRVAAPVGRGRLVLPAAVSRSVDGQGDLVEQTA
jgi:hypothetical protein